MNPPCTGQHKLFDSTDANDHARAKAMCLNSCAFLDWCRSRLTDAQAKAIKDGGPTGTWAGQLLRVNGGREVRSAETLAAEDAAYSIEEGVRAHNAWTHHGDRSEWAKTGERVYQRRRGARARSAA